MVEETLVEEEFESLKKIHHVEKFKGASRRKQIKNLLGSKLKAIRTAGDELELILEEPLNPSQRQKVKKIWEREE